ncbi:MAG: GtrA family protein [Clostridia bacterium]|nr:GtrA family protein [Clostridia bacterium]
MTLQDITVLLLGSAPPGLADALRQAGFGAVAERGPDRSVRDALAALTQGTAAGIVTVDDSQGWSADDVTALGRMLTEDPARLYIGEPSAAAEKPNWIEEAYLFLSGVRAASAQTGLFAMSRETALTMTRMKSAEDNFLMNMPLEARSLGIETVEVTEADVHAPQPTAQLLKRSFKLYQVFLKFSLAAMIAYVVDIGTFGLFQIVFGGLADEFKILWSTILSRVLCSLATYILNRSAVFKSQQPKSGRSMVRFVILSVAQLAASWLLVWWIGSLFGGSDFVNMILKIVVDLIIFLASFTIMRDWVFKDSAERPAS